jgi:plastocyanin
LTKPFITTLVVAIAAMTVAACGSSGGSSSTTAASPAPSGGSAAGASGGQNLKLSADPGGAIRFNTDSLSAKSGTVTISMQNPSSSGLQHGIAVEGNGVDEDGQIVGPGGTSTVTVDLKPGTYKFYCPFDSHEQQGMEGTLTVK